MAIYLAAVAPLPAQQSQNERIKEADELAITWDEKSERFTAKKK